MELTEQNVWQCLSQVQDPELHLDIVSLGLVYGVVISNDHVHITMTLTTPGCPLAGMFDTLVKSALQNIDDLDINKQVSLELTFDPPWIPDMMTDEAKAELGFD